MNILHIITSLESGGAERMLSYLASYDNKNKHTIITILKSNIHYTLANNLEVIELNLENNTQNKIKSFFLIKSLIRKLKPDIVQTWMKINYFGPFLKFLNPDPKYIINIRHGVNKKYNKFSSTIENLYLNYIDGCIFVSNASKREYIKNGIDIKNSIVISNGFTKKSYQYSLNQNNKLKLGYVGRKDKIKNQELLFKAFNKFCKNKDVELIVAGKNMLYKNFKSIVNDEAKYKIQWLGEVKNSFDVYKNIDILILTSLSEGFPNVIGEAMSIGVPVISTNAGESWDIIKESGYKISMNSDELIWTLENIYYNREQLLLKSEDAYKIIQDNFTLEKIIEQYLYYYEGVLK